MSGPTHFRVTILSRSQGRNAVEAAAYRSGSKLRADMPHVWADRRTTPEIEAVRAEAGDALEQLKNTPADDLERRKALALVIRKAAYQSGTVQEDKKGRMTFDYSTKEGVLHTEILAPKNAPDWVQDRSRLWNEVEAGEKRKNAQLARDLVIALPRTTTHEQNVQFVRGYLQKTFVREGMIADFAIHESMASDGKPNPHVHVLLTMREIGPEGFNPKKATPKARSWNDPKNVAKWRDAWMQDGNAFLERLGLDERIEMRSYAARGIDKVGTKHLGAEADRLEKRGKKTRAGDANREIEAENARRAHAGDVVPAGDPKLPEMVTIAAMLSAEARRDVQEIGAVLRQHVRYAGEASRDDVSPGWSVPRMPGSSCDIRYRRYQAMQPRGMDEWQDVPTYHLGEDRTDLRDFAFPEKLDREHRARKGREHERRTERDGRLTRQREAHEQRDRPERER